MKREDWNERYAGVESLWAKRPNRFLVAEVGDLAPGRALDLACGEGQNAIWLASLGWEVTAVDFSDVAIEKARRRAAEAGLEVAFVCADLLDFEPEEGVHDLVVVLYLHFTAPERRIILPRAARALAPGGVLVVIGHDSTNLGDGVGGPTDPAVLFTPAEIADELPGLEIEKAERVLRDVEGEDRPAIDALVRARRP